MAKHNGQMLGDREILDYFRNTPEGRRMESAAQTIRQTNIDRKTAADGMVDLQNQRETALGELQRAAAETEAALEEAKEKFAAATEAHGRARQNCDSLKQSIEAQNGAHVRTLRNTCDPRIVAFIRELSDQFENNRHTAHKSRVEKKVVGGRLQKGDVFNNRTAVEAWRVAIRQATQAAEDLKLRVDIDVDTELARIASTVPELSDELEKCPPPPKKETARV